jgi:hypothetical protein
MKQTNQRSPVVIGVIILLSWLVTYYTSSSLPFVPTQTKNHEFKMINAREYLENITALGPRVTGEIVLF